MIDSEEDSKSSHSWLNPNIILGLVTILGGYWLVTNNLTSDRPVVKENISIKNYIGEQTLEARLWEDPFRGGNSESLDYDDLDELAFVFGSRRSSAVTAHGSKPPQKDLLLMPVMVSGGQYSEDLESRIRSRFAVLSALGEAGYEPEDAEHIGVMEIPWPSMWALESWKKGVREQNGKSAAVETQMAHLRKMSDRRLSIRFEWFKPRAYFPAPELEKYYKSVLVMWIDNASFEDDPLFRLALLFEPFAGLMANTGKANFRIALLGPRRSTTLNKMVSTETQYHAGQAMDDYVRSIRSNVELYCATVSAMDEVLVQDNEQNEPEKELRGIVSERLTGKDALGKSSAGDSLANFKGFYNFAATDDQLAREVLDELRLRGVDTADAKQHIVLVSEWDTFYARALSLTYRVELMFFRDRVRHENLRRYTRRQVVNAYLTAAESSMLKLPENFHSFSYMRGLDGQTVGESANRAESGGKDGGKSGGDGSEILKKWKPDTNQAEGQAQFDYLGRLGDRIEALQEQLCDGGHGDVKAIGIVGSDVYDVLLILQALRKRFPNILFFTTDLDVRYCNPKESAWARNLIVASSYGFMLNPDFQGAVMPFRDSTQTAQFAATLAILGNKSLLNVPDAPVPPRRFEIGNKLAVDISVADNSIRSSEVKNEPVVKQWLHPATLSESYNFYKSTSDHLIHNIVGLFVIAFLFFLVSRSWRSLRCMTVDWWSYLLDSVTYTEEDVGGGRGGFLILRHFRNPPNPAGAFHHIDVEVRARYRGFINARLNHALLDRTNVQLIVDALNQYVADTVANDENHRRRGSENYSFFKKLFSCVLPNGRLRRIRKLGRIRSHVDSYIQSIIGTGRLRAETVDVQPESKLVDYLIKQPLEPLHTVALPGGQGRRITYAEGSLLAATAARDCARRIFRLRFRGLLYFRIAAPVFIIIAAVLTVFIWRDTFLRADGEPFSLLSGISSWPAECVRLLVIFLSVTFIAVLAHTMRESFLQLTRRFRFPGPAIEETQERDGFKFSRFAVLIWYDFRRKSRFRNWCKTGVVLVFSYLALMTCMLFAFGDEIMSPLRGSVNMTWNYILIWLAAFGFLYLAFYTIHMAFICRELIRRLGNGVTVYPKATEEYFSQGLGRVPVDCLDDWVDLQLIGELTEQVGRLVYYPVLLMLLMLLARNSWWDNWPWPTSLVIVFALNILLAMGSVIVLQKAARDAKANAIKSLSAKVRHYEAAAAPVAQNNANQANRLLEDLRKYKRGAFVPFWENPVVGAIFLSSGGTTLIQLLGWIMNQK